MALQDDTDEGEAHMSAEAVRAVLEAELRLQDGDSAGAVRLLKEAVLFDPGSSYLQVRLAETYLSSGDAEHALGSARAALALDRHSVPALRVIGAAHTLTGEASAALRAYEQALTIAPTDRDTVTALTELLVEQGDTKRAEQVVERLMDAEPGAVDGYVTLGRTFAQRGDVQRAFFHLDRALAREPLDTDALDLVFALQVALGRFADAKKTADALARALGDTPVVRRELLAVTALANQANDAEAMARSWLRDDDSETMHLLVADGWRRAGELERAIAVLAHASGPRVQIDRALLLLSLRRPEAARAEACAAIAAAADADGKDFAVTVCARALAALDRNAEAAKLVDRHLEERPASARLLAASGEISRENGNTRQDTGRVLSRLEQAHHAAPADPTLLEVFSRAHEERGDLAPARSVIDDALRARPSDPELLMVLARFLDRQGHAQAAADIAERLVERGRRDVDTLNFLAFVLADASLRSEDARRYAWRAVMLDPLNGYVLDTLGWALFASGDAGAALDVLRRADRLSPNEAEVLFHVASAQLADGDTAGAVETARRAHKLAPSDKRMRARIDTLLTQLGAGV
jgi:tetratricopeptide (TPR) repeat protein